LIHFYKRSEMKFLFVVFILPAMVSSQNVLGGPEKVETKDLTQEHLDIIQIAARALADKKWGQCQRSSQTDNFSFVVNDFTVQSVAGTLYNFDLTINGKMACKDKTAHCMMRVFEAPGEEAKVVWDHSNICSGGQLVNFLPFLPLIIAAALFRL